MAPSLVTVLIVGNISFNKPPGKRVAPHSQEIKNLCQITTKMRHIHQHTAEGFGNASV